MANIVCWIFNKAMVSSYQTIDKSFKTLITGRTCVEIFLTIEQDHSYCQSYSMYITPGSFLNVKLVTCVFCVISNQADLIYSRFISRTKSDGFGWHTLKHQYGQSLMALAGIP